MQRVPRFKLLLEQLLQATPQGHPDRAATETALSEFAKLASAVNEVYHAARHELVKPSHAWLSPA